MRHSRVLARPILYSFAIRQLGMRRKVYGGSIAVSDGTCRLYGRCCHPLIKVGRSQSGMKLGVASTTNLQSQLPGGILRRLSPQYPSVELQSLIGAIDPLYTSRDRFDTHSMLGRIRSRLAEAGRFPLMGCGVDMFSH